MCILLQAAHVGIGISGLEGLQATLASDYAIAQVVQKCALVKVYIVSLVLVPIPYQTTICSWYLELPTTD